MNTKSTTPSIPSHGPRPETCANGWDSIFRPSNHARRKSDGTRRDETCARATTANAHVFDFPRPLSERAPIMTTGVGTCRAFLLRSRDVRGGNLTSNRSRMPVIDSTGYRTLPPVRRTELRGGRVGSNVVTSDHDVSIRSFWSVPNGRPCPVFLVDCS